jgi:aminoglycoside 6-adenylyltransferase
VDQDRVLSEVVSWAGQEENVRAAIVTGSVARGDDTRDALSDLDIELYVRDPERLLAVDDWYRRFGDVLVVEALDNDGWNPTRLVYYVDGKIDFTVIDVTTGRMTAPARHAHRIVVDKDGVSPRLSSGSAAPPGPPSAEAFARCINWFYAAAIMCAKCLARNEPWPAKYRDWDLKIQLLLMIEWDHKSRYGWDYDTWHNGAHMAAWMDALVAERLPACWADFSVEAAKQALAASISLFDELSVRTASKLGATQFDADTVRREIESILAS